MHSTSNLKKYSWLTPSCAVTPRKITHGTQAVNSNRGDWFFGAPFLLRKKPGFPLQSFGSAKRISAQSLARPKGFLAEAPQSAGLYPEKPTAPLAIARPSGGVFPFGACLPSFSLQIQEFGRIYAPKSE
jgi:hypothetical protein